MQAGAIAAMLTNPSQMAHPQVRWNTRLKYALSTSYNIGFLHEIRIAWNLHLVQSIQLTCYSLMILCQCQLRHRCAMDAHVPTPIIYFCFDFRYVETFLNPVHLINHLTRPRLIREVLQRFWRHRAWTGLFDTATIWQFITELDTLNFITYVRLQIITYHPQNTLILLIRITAYSTSNYSYW